MEVIRALWLNLSLKGFSFSTRKQKPEARMRPKVLAFARVDSFQFLACQLFGSFRYLYLKFILSCNLTLDLPVS